MLESKETTSGRRRRSAIRRDDKLRLMCFSDGKRSQNPVLLVRRRVTHDHDDNVDAISPDSS